MYLQILGFLLRGAAQVAVASGRTLFIAAAGTVRAVVTNHGGKLVWLLANAAAATAAQQILLPAPDDSENTIIVEGELPEDKFSIVESMMTELSNLWGPDWFRRIARVKSILTEYLPQLGLMLNERFDTLTAQQVKRLQEGDMEYLELVVDPVDGTARVPAGSLIPDVGDVPDDALFSEDQWEREDWDAGMPEPTEVQRPVRSPLEGFGSPAPLETAFRVADSVRAFSRDTGIPLSKVMALADILEDMRSAEVRALVQRIAERSGGERPAGRRPGWDEW